ncbi:MAG TPA: group I intron-associated PD-(D/E)XK endonuclease [Terriglobales bacterium]|nr:group I intron-associated PD-(D/E)XK endonuclease [Terriglobales bacterium]
MKKIERARPRWCPRLRHRRDKGDWAELVFVVKAIGLGFTVCRPYGDNHRFDFLVFAPGGPIHRVQVKSSWGKTANMYRFKANASGRHRYRKDEVDFVVVYVAPEEAWYVIPRGKLARYDVGYVMPHIPGSRAQWENYREAWERFGGKDSPQRTRRYRGRTVASSW